MVENSLIHVVLKFSEEHFTLSNIKHIKGWNGQLTCSSNLWKSILVFASGVIAASASAARFSSLSCSSAWSLGHGNPLSV